MSKCGLYEHCESCINKELDPFQCEECEDGSNYEPEDGDEEDFEEDMEYADFIDLMRETA